MNPGGEPERDDTGLPPVDIEIPDDARELDRDVQAYYRELRAEQRRQRRRQISRRLGSDGIVLPLLACCLILALITGTLLTIFTATSDQNLTNVPGYGTAPTNSRAHGGATGSASPSSGSRSPGTTPAKLSPPAHSASSGASGAAALSDPSIVTTSAPLPAGTLTLPGNLQIPLPTLSGAMLILITKPCHCTAAVRWLADIGAQRHAPTFLVGTRTSLSEARWLIARLSPATQKRVGVALDAQDVLQGIVPRFGLTVLLVGSAQDGSAPLVSFANRVTPGGSAALIVQALSS